MKVGKLFVLSLAVCAAMVAFAFYAAGRLPPGAELPIHWNAAGEVDGTASALVALIMPAGLLLLISAIFALVPRIEPLQDRLEGSAPLLRSTWIMLLAMFVFVQGLVAAPAFGAQPDGSLILLPVGALLVVLGNMLPKSRPGFFVGIRTPWTIVDEDVWIATHRLGGKLMMVAGGVLVVSLLLPLAAELRATLTIAAIAVAVVVPAAYSWWLWHGKSRGAQEPE